MRWVLLFMIVCILVTDADIAASGLGLTSKHVKIISLVCTKTCTFIYCHTDEFVNVSIKDSDDSKYATATLKNVPRQTSFSR